MGVGECFIEAMAGPGYAEQVEEGEGAKRWSSRVL